MHCGNIILDHATQSGIADFANQTIGLRSGLPMVVANRLEFSNEITHVTVRDRLWPADSMLTLLYHWQTGAIQRLTGKSGDIPDFLYKMGVVIDSNVDAIKEYLRFFCYHSRMCLEGTHRMVPFVSIEGPIDLLAAWAPGVGDPWSYDNLVTPLELEDGGIIEVSSDFLP